MKKRREFWILEFPYNDPQQVLGYEPHSFNSVHNEHIHVVEIEALKEAEAQLAKLAEALKKMCPNHPRDQMTENAIIQVAREALAELSKARGE